MRMQYMEQEAHRNKQPEKTTVQALTGKQTDFFPRMP
jgi:hypothetical protein